MESNNCQPIYVVVLAHTQQEHSYSFSLAGPILFDVFCPAMTTDICMELFNREILETSISEVYQYRPKYIGTILGMRTFTWKIYKIWFCIFVWLIYLIIRLYYFRVNRYHKISRSFEYLIWKLIQQTL